MDNTEKNLINKVQQLIIFNEQVNQKPEVDSLDKIFKINHMEDVHEEATKLYITLEKYVNILLYLENSIADKTLGIFTKSVIQVHKIHYKTEQLIEELKN